MTTARQLIEGGKNFVAQSVDAQLERKWAKLLEGIGAPRTRVVMARLYENEKNYLSQLDEETRSTNVGPYLKYVFPLLTA